MLGKLQVLAHESPAWLEQPIGFRQHFQRIGQVARQQPHVDNVKAPGCKLGVVRIGLHVLDGSRMLALGTMPFRHHKLGRIHAVTTSVTECIVG
jgi:hypothetical protein